MSCLLPEKVFFRMNTRIVNHDFDSAAFGDMFQRISLKITAVSVGPLASASIAHEADFVRALEEALHADEEELVWHPASASYLTYLGWFIVSPHSAWHPTY